MFFFASQVLSYIACVLSYVLSTIIGFDLEKQQPNPKLRKSKKSKAFLKMPLKMRFQLKWKGELEKSPKFLFNHVSYFGNEFNYVSNY